ncbi:Nitrogen permease regulator 3, partial [Kickxella alabastrina]
EVVRLHVHRRIALSLHIPRGPALERAAPPAPAPRPVFWTGGYVVADGGGYAPADGSAAASAAHTPRPQTPADGAPVAPATTRSVAADVQEYGEALHFGPAPTLAQAQLHTYQAQAHAHQLHTPQRLHRIGALPPPGIVAADRELGPGDHAQYPRIEAYHALLLTGDDAPALRRRLQLTDASPTLLAVVDKASPTRTLAVLHRMVDCSFAQLLRVAAHLVYWGAARLVCPVSLGATYAVQRVPPTLHARFAARAFTLCSLAQLLARLHPPRPAAQVLEAVAGAARAKDRGVRGEFREMLVLLLREDAVAQLHTWPVALVPSHVRHGLSEDRFVCLAFAWFRSLHAAHPDLLGA